MKKHFQFLLFIVLIQVFACKPNIEIPKPDQGSADFTRTVALGGNFLSGYQDDALCTEGQEFSIPGLLAVEFKLATPALTFNQPFILVSEGLGINNKPWESLFNTRRILGYKTDCEGVRDLFPNKLLLLLTKSEADARLRSYPNGSIQNLAMPFCSTADVFDPAFGSSSGNFYYSHFTSQQGTSTLLIDALMQNPTFGIFWFGMEDIFSYAANGGKDISIPSPAVFENSLDSILKTFTAHGAKGVIANIPDFESFPFYTLISPREVNLTKVQADSLNLITLPNLFNEGENGFIIEFPKGSGQYRQMRTGEFVLLDVPVDSLKCNYLGVATNLPDRYSLDSTEVNVINDAVESYNQVIYNKAKQYNLAYVDANGFFKKVKSGIKWNSEEMNAEFVSGGFFSLDGYHPHQKGYSILANEFIKAINDAYGSTVPWVNCESCSGVLFPNQ